MEREGVMEELTVSESSLTEGPMAPSPDRSCRNLDGKLDLRVAIYHLYFSTSHILKLPHTKKKNDT